MVNSQNKGTWVILLGFVISFALTLLPFPESIAAYQPQWTFLGLCFWVIALPHRIGLLWAFICGLFLDSLVGVTLGINSFALIIIVFILKLQYKRLRLFPYWKQGLAIFALALLYVGIVFWLAKINGKPEFEFAWKSALISGLFWPFWSLSLRNIRRYFNVS